MSDRLALSALDWWNEAGVDVIVDDLPRDWLAKPSFLAPVGPAGNGGAGTAASGPLDGGISRTLAERENKGHLPSDLPGFRAWLLTDLSVPGTPRARHDAAGDPGSGCMVVLDMPEQADRGENELLTGEAGALFDRMLAAIGLTRDAIYLAPFAPARPITGKLDKPSCDLLERLMRHHIALAQPRRLLLLGEAAVCALTGRSVASARGIVHRIEAGGMSVPAIASFAPRLVHGRAEWRRPAWADLQAFMAVA